MFSAIDGYARAGIGRSTLLQVRQAFRFSQSNTWGDLLTTSGSFTAGAGSVEPAYELCSLLLQGQRSGFRTRDAL